MENDENETDAPQIYLLGKTYLKSNEEFYIRNDSIIHIAAGDRHTIIVVESGRAYAFGDNNSGQLGLGHTNNVEKVSCIKSLKFGDTGEKVILAACGRESSLVATDQGSLYGFGANYHCQLGFESDGSTKIHPIPVKIASFRLPMSWEQISMGAEHTCALTMDGEVYVWGSNEEGQCGQLRKYNIIKAPRQLRLEYAVIDISCGYYHTGLISEDGRLFLFGNNTDRQLGRSKSDQNNDPLEVSLPDRVNAVACGHQHTVVLTEEGEVYTCGRNNRGQLGLGSGVSTAEKFQLIENLPKQLTAVAVGEGHTAVVDFRGDIYVFGDGTHGKLSYKTQSNEFEPCSIDKFKGYNVLKVVCGGCQTIILAQKSESIEDDEDFENTTDPSLQFVEPFYSRNSPLHTEPNDDQIDLSASARSILMNTTHREINGKLQPTKSSIKSAGPSINNEHSEPSKTKTDDLTKSKHTSDHEKDKHSSRIKTSSDENNDPKNREISSSTTSGRTSSSISSVHGESQITDTKLVNDLQNSSPSSATNTLAKPYTINSSTTESQPGFFSRLFGGKSSQTVTTTHNNSRTCSIM